MIKKHLIMRSFVVAIAAIATFFSGASTVFAEGPHTNIVGGTNATQSLTVSLQSVSPSGANHECGGVLIAPKWVMSAAHCAPYIKGQARIGSLNWRQTGEVISVSNVYSHPQHDSTKGFGNDLALVQLTKAAKTKPVPVSLYGPVGSQGIAQGWGITCDVDVNAPGCGDQTPDFLQQLKMRRTTDHYCDLTNSAGVQLNDPSTMMCVVTADGSHAGTCFGDSGSPYLEDRRDPRDGQTKKAVTGIMIALMNNTVATPHVCSQTPDGGPNRDAATKVASLLPWVIKTLLQNDSSAAQYVQDNTL